jgi:TATA-box binding protein (TBP) (component of TFIID and TFIIIB)
MTQVNWLDYKYVDIIGHEKNEIRDLPDGVTISTMCASCKLNSLVNVINIKDHLQLHEDDIVTVKMSDDKKRTLVPPKIKNKRLTTKVKEVKQNSFYNQITVVVRIGCGPVIDWETEPKINLKLFKNGSIQMSGCKSLKNINIVLNKLIYRLQQVKAKIEDGKIVEKKYIETNEKLELCSFKVDMINSNYKVNMQIDRAKLYSLLLKKKIKSSFEPCIRACVIIKYTPEQLNDEGKEISIFVFQKGNIIITGARTKPHILAAYKYINNILVTHYEEINKKDEKEEEDLILQLYDNIVAENNINASYTL